MVIYHESTHGDLFGNPPKLLNLHSWGVPFSMNQVILEPRERDVQSRDIQDASGAEVPVLLPSICENKIPSTELSR